MDITKIIGSGLKSALIIGGSGFIFGFIGPGILVPEANQGPLLGIFITGPVGFLLGGLIGLVVGVISQYSETRAPNSILRLVSKAWNWILWGSASLAAVIIIVGIVYIPWHENKYSSIANNASDLHKRDKSLTQLRVRFLSDDEIRLLEQFKQLNDLDFFAGWGVGQAKITDEGLKKLSELHLPRLEMLMLGYCSRITDDGMQYVARIKNLKYFSLTACVQITDDGLLKLTSANEIATIDLRGCKGITDRGLGHLTKMPKLKKVLLGGCTNVTAAGMDELRKALPNCKVTKDDREWAWHTK